VSHVATGSIAAADAVAARTGGPAGAELVSAAHAAFVHAMSLGLRVAAAVALASAIAAIFALPRRGSEQAAGQAESGPAVTPAGDSGNVVAVA
jgi:hypothetical protein